MKITINVTDSAELSAIATMRQRYNEEFPEAPIETDAAYVEHVLRNAVVSWVANA